MGNHNVYRGISLVEMFKSWIIIDWNDLEVIYYIFYIQLH